MQKNINESFHFWHKIASFFKKKRIVFFILACMSVNGFVSHLGNVNQYSFVMMFVSIAKHASVQVLNKYGGSMIAVANKVCIEMMETVIPAKAAHSADSRKQDNNKQNNNANDCAVIISALKVVSKRVTAVESGDGILLFSFGSFLKSFDSYNGRYPAAERGCIIVLMFLLFIAAIRNRKIISVTALNRADMVCKRRVSA